MTPEERKEYNKEWRENNKEKIEEYKKKWSENNKEEIKENKKKYYENNKEKIIEQQKEYQKINKEKIQEYKKKYKQTPLAIKNNRITNWKQKGVKFDDWEALYKHYMSTEICDNCEIELVEGQFGGNKRCLDHDHATGAFRNILCNTCNIRRG
tara:strand:- start:191 stop:649 length:459 start_codon:yes stop_codon:yes gene_type:complete